MKKWDGHTHTEFCPHGSSDKVVDRIEKAIKLGFNRYSLTEHAPLPEEGGADIQLWSECGMSWEQTAEYFKFVSQLKKVYQRKITLLTGLEIDYLPGYENFTCDLIKRYQSDLDEWIISLHFLRGEGGLRLIDYNPEEFQDGLVNFYGSVDQTHLVYWDCVRQMLEQDFDFFPPQRIAHLGLIRKFILRFPLDSKIFSSHSFYQPLMKRIKNRGYALDFNVIGLSITTCQEAYLTKPMLHWCKEYGIELVYGSDAHRIDSVGDNYAVFHNYMAEINRR